MPLFNSLMVATNQDLSVATLSFNDYNQIGGGQDNNGAWANSSGGADQSGSLQVFNDPDSIISFSGQPTNNYFRITKAGTYVLRFTIDQLYWEGFPTGDFGNYYEFEFQGPFPNLSHDFVRFYAVRAGPPVNTPNATDLAKLVNVDITRTVTITASAAASTSYNVLSNAIFCQWATQNLNVGKIDNARLTINEI